MHSIKEPAGLTITGLTESEVFTRKQQGLVNTAVEKNTKSTGRILYDNIFTLFNALNLSIGICLALVGAWANMAYLIIITLDIGIRIVQELRAKKLVENLSLLSEPKATAVRDGQKLELPTENLVLDDVILLSMGNQVCVDSTVIHGEIEVDESLLTGEADPVFKRPGDTLLSGSFLVSGNCHAKTTHVGADNFVSQMAQGAKKHRKINSELSRSMLKVTKFTGFFIIPLGILLFLESYFLSSDGVFHTVVSTSAALLGMLPKGLMLLISISLAAGVIKLSKRKVLVQEMHSIETLAHVDMLCLDKTGTLTEGKMRVSNVCIFNESAVPIPAEQAIGLFMGTMNDNNATFIALKEYFWADSTVTPTATIPFSSQRKWSGAAFAGIGTILLSAPELFAESMLPEEVRKAQRAGIRVLLLGYCENAVSDNFPANALPFAAVFLTDPIRQNAKETLAFFKREGVEIRIISGDRTLTVSAIAKEAGFDGWDSYVDMSNLHTPEEIEKVAKQYRVFGRVTPNQKCLLIKALQAMGHTVAMTGDGVNDVLALREADCNIAMASGSDAARQVSQIVLIDSDFSSLPDVVMEGRRVVNNITRIAGIFFIKTIYSVLLSVFSILTLSEFPFIPIQITLIDTIIEALPGLFLSFERNRQKPQGAFLPTVIGQAAPYALLILLGFLSAALLSSIGGIPGMEARTILYYATGFISLSALVQACRPFNRFRMLLCMVSAGGFFTIAYLFAGILNLENFTPIAFAAFITFSIVSIPLGILLKRCASRVFYNSLRTV
ncbi:ATPase [Clostridia bacterium]|nr:ATPase [Clostridia bacterium]